MANKHIDEINTSVVIKTNKNLRLQMMSPGETAHNSDAQSVKMSI